MASDAGSPAPPPQPPRHGDGAFDFADPEPSQRIKKYASYSRTGDYTVCRCTFTANPGEWVTSRQLLIGIYNGPNFRLMWQSGGEEKAATIRSGMAFVFPPRVRYFMGWGDVTPRFSVIAIDTPTTDRILSEACPYTIRLDPAFGVRDDVLQQLVKAAQNQAVLQTELVPVFMEGLGAALVTHVYRTYGNAAFPRIAKGGLTPRDAKRVLTFIEDNLHRDIGLSELAGAVSLSVHYFIDAFKKTIGMPPYRYVLHRRVERAKELLLAADLPPARIAEEVGFSSQSQLITTFRKIVGTTPARYRRDAQ